VGRETWPLKPPPHNDRVPAIPPISRDVASPGLCWPAAKYRQSWRSTRLNLGILSPPQSAHRGSSHHTAAQPVPNDTARRNPASVFGTCLPRRGRPFTHQVARSGSAIQSQTRSRELRLHPAEGMPRRRRFDVGGSGLSGKWSLPVPSPAPSHRLTKYEATGAAFSTTSVRTPRWLRTNTMAGGLAPAGSAAAQFAYRPGNRGRRGRIASSRLCPPTNRD
jgi:hypothetical protein